MSPGVMRTRYRLGLLPLAVAGIVAATAVPIELRGAVWWGGGFGYRDIAENLLLYAPLGIALWRRPLWLVFAVAMLLSTAIELTQVWSIRRYSSPIDVGANAVGALIAAWAWRRAPAIETRGVDIWWITGAASIAVVVLAIWALPVRSSALSNWDPDFQLLLGNEVSRNRPWQGDILDLAIVPSALPLDAPHSPRAGAGEITRSNPIVLRDGKEIVLPHPASRDFARAAMRSNAFTVAARVATADTIQKGPARIVSFSIDPFHRNFDLGQQARQLVFRVRTPVSGINGQLFRTESPPILQPGKDTRIVASYDGAVARIHVDGQLRARSNLAAAGCSVPALCDTAVPLMWALLGASMAILALAIVPWHGRVQAVGLSLLAGAAAFVFPGLLRIADVPISTQPWTQWMALFGAVTIGMSALRQDAAVARAEQRN